MNIIIGSDHRGFTMKAHLKQYLIVSDEPIAWIDVGTSSPERTDYPIYAQAAVAAMKKKEATMAILICGSGAGMAIAANRYPEIRAAVAWNGKIAAMVKEDDDVNVLVVPSDFVSSQEAIDIARSWLIARFKGGRYQDRIAMIDKKR